MIEGSDKEDVNADAIDSNNTTFFGLSSFNGCKKTDFSV